MKNAIEERLEACQKRIAADRSKAAASSEKLERENPVVCEYCGESMPVDWSRREEAYSHLQRIGEFPRGIVCDECEVKRREEQDRERQERAEQRQREAAESHQRQRAEAERVRQEELRQVRENVPAALARCGVPPVLQRADLKNCPDLPGELIDRVCTWTEDPQGFLVLSGPPGAGKGRSRLSDRR